MTDLAEMIVFVRAQLDEDERIARAAAGPRGEFPVWEVDEWYVGDVVAGPQVPQALLRAKALGSITSQPIDRVAAEHAARHNPARVLAEIDAKRRILDLHARDHLCAGIDNTADQAEPYGNIPGGEACLTVHLLTLPYADRPGYREEWRP